MNKRHKWADVIIAWANGEKIQYLNVHENWVLPVLELINPISHPDHEWRIKPRTIKIGDMEVPEPIKEPPELETVLYIPKLDVDDFVYEFFFRGLDHQYHRIDRGLCHLSEEAAITHAKALIKISGGTID